MVAQQTQHPQGLPLQRLHGAQQRGLLVQHLAAPGAEAGGDIEGIVLDEGGRGAVPGGIAPGLKGHAQAAGGEGGGVALAADQLLAGEAHHDGAILLGMDKALVLFRRGAGEGLEPMGKMGRALIQRPALQAVGHDIRQRRILHGPALIDNLFQLLVGIPRQIAAHGIVIEDAAGVAVDDIAGSLVHKKSSPFCGRLFGPRDQK